MKQLIKKHRDVITVLEELQQMKRDYETQGYDCELLLNCLKINFCDGYVMIYWEKGSFWEDYHFFEKKR